MTDSLPALVAVDFTATRLDVLLAEPGGGVLLRQTYALPDPLDEDAWAWEVGGRIASAFAAEGNHRWALAIAVACPGYVDSPTGRMVESAAREGWDGLAVVEALRRHIDVPIVALGRTEAALRGEAAAGAAAATFDALYVSLSDDPPSAILSSGRVVGGATRRAGALPALPEMTPGEVLEGEALEGAAALLADAATLLDPAVVVIHGAQEHVMPLIPVLQRVLDQVAAGIDVVPAALGDGAALVGALQAASIAAYEGERAALEDEE